MNVWTHSADVHEKISRRAWSLDGIASGESASEVRLKFRLRKLSRQNTRLDSCESFALLVLRLQEFRGAFLHGGALRLDCLLCKRP